MQPGARTKIWHCRIFGLALMHLFGAKLTGSVWFLQAYLLARF